MNKSNLDEALLQQAKNKLTQAIESIKTGVNNEIVKTSDAYKLIKMSVISGIDLTIEEKKQVGDQLKSILIKLGYASLLVIPGAMTTMILLKILKKKKDLKKMNNLHESNKITGGLSDKITIKDIAIKFNVSTSEIEKQIRMGLTVEREHTNDISKAREIAMDHLSEMPDYYTRLEKMEKEAIKYAKKKTLNEGGKPMIKLLLRETLSSLSKKKRYINESVVTGKIIINVDIQPEYESYISFNVKSWVEFINESSFDNRIIFLYNGEDTMGMVSEMDYKMWLLDLGVNEDVIDTSRFYDKGYAFFRYCMDSNIDENNVADLVRFMSNHDITDSREINSEMWNQYMEETNHDQSDVRELLENADDMISIPDLMEFLSNFNNIVLTGGGINECLKEVEIALLALNKPFNTLSQFTY